MPTPREGYRLKDGTSVPGTTTVIGRWKDSGPLLHWAFKQGRGGARTLYEERDKAADVGTMAHGMVEAHLTGTDPHIWLSENHAAAPAEQRAKACTAYRAFESWLGNQRAEVISAEQPMVSEVHRFGGTPDAVLRMPDGTLALGDVKTSNGIYRDYLLQVAAYGLLWNEIHPDDPITGGFHILRFGKEEPDFEHRYYNDLSGAAELFLLLRRAYDLDLILKKRCG
jgi:hypothetical protein